MSYRNIITSHYPVMYRPLSGGVTSGISEYDTPLFFENLFATSGVAASNFLSAGSYSIGAWMFTYGPGGAMSMGTSSGLNMVIGDASGNIQIAIGRRSTSERATYISASHTTGTRIECSALVPLYKAFHFVVTWDGSTLKVYIDGVQRSFAAGSGSVTLTGTFGVGRMFGSSSGINRVWGVGTWGIALTDNQILDWYNGTVPSSPTGYWPMTSAASGGSPTTLGNSGGTAGIDLTMTAVYRSTDDRTYSITGSLDQNSTSLLPADGYSSTYFDGNVANYISGQTFYETNASGLYQPYVYEYWMNEASFSTFNCLVSQGSTTNINRHYIDAKNTLQIVNNTPGTILKHPQFPVQLGTTYHVIIEYQPYGWYYNSIGGGLTSKTWINGRLVGETFHNTFVPDSSPSSPATFWHTTLIGHAAVTNQSTIAANTAFVGNIQELALYRREFDNSMALQHYLAGTDTSNTEPTLISANWINSGLILLTTSKPIFPSSREDISIPGVTVNGFSHLDTGDLLVSVWNTEPEVYLRLSETSGDFADSTGNGYTGLAAGTITRSVVGAIDTAISFSSAADGYVDVSVPFMATSTSDSFTVSFWFNPVSITTGNVIVSCSNGTTGWEIDVSGTTIRGVLYGSGTVTSVITPHINAWNMLTFVYRQAGGGSFVELWKNNSLAGKSSTATTYVPYNGVVRIGNRASATSVGARTNGSVDDFKIYRKALTPEEISFLYQAGMAQETAATSVPIDGYTYTVTLDSSVTDARGAALINSVATATLEHMTVTNPENQFDGLSASLVNPNTLATTITGSRIRYYMRAYNTNLSQFVYWSVLDEPDFTGIDSGYSPGDLQNIIKIGQTV